jgi:hypothetical protein
MNKTIKMYSYYLNHDCDKDAIGLEAQSYGCEVVVGAMNRAIITMWETNPYNSFFVLKYAKNLLAIKEEDWVL